MSIVELHGRRYRSAPPALLKLFTFFAWLVAIALPLYVFVLFPLADMFGSAIAGGRGRVFPWRELLLVSSPLLVAAWALAAAAIGLRRGSAGAARLFAATLAVLIVIDGLLLAFYQAIRPWGVLDYRPVGGLRLSTWQFLDSLFFSAWVTGGIFLMVLLGFAVWCTRPGNRGWFG